MNVNKPDDVSDASAIPSSVTKILILEASSTGSINAAAEFDEMSTEIAINISAQSHFITYLSKRHAP